MAKSIFGISTSSNQLPRESIKEVATRTVNLLRVLSEKDSIFKNVVFIGKDDNDRFNLDLSSIENTSQELAELILKYAKGSISSYDKENRPTVNFSRDYGFSNVYQVYAEDKKILSVFTNFGGSQGGGIGIVNIHKEVQFTFDWYFDVLKLLIEETQAFFGTVSINNTAFIDMYTPLKVKYPLGWINYFSKKCDVKIPDDIEAMEYEQTDKGKYLILTRDDFTENKELFFSHRERLITVMAEIKRRVPEYGK